MKRLNKKGFTLIELLAVIVILAVVMVVTIPSVLNSMGSARQKQLDNVRSSMEEFLQKNYDLCASQITNEFGSDIKIADIFNVTDGKKVCNSVDTTKLISAAGYNNSDISSVTASCDNTTYKCTVSNVTATADGKFKGLVSSAG